MLKTESATFAASNLGTVNCSNILHTQGAKTKLCICDAGYFYDTTQAKCFCDMRLGYALVNDICVPCSIQSDSTACSGCKAPYFQSNSYTC